MSKNSYKDGKRVGDYVGFCDTCGQKFWATQGTELDKYTGLGGAWVCPNCVDNIDYGLVPFKVLGEKGVPLSRNSLPDVTAAPDITTINPMSISNPETEL